MSVYSITRMENDVGKKTGGELKRMVRRSKNKYLGRKLIRKTWRFPF